MKEKKGHAGLVILIIVLVIIFLPIGVVFALCYDNSKREHVPSQDYTAVVQKSLADSFRSAKEQKKLNLRVTQEDLNGVLEKALTQMPVQAKDYVKGLFVDINNQNYDFRVELDVPGFSTVAVLKTQMTEVVDNVNPLKGSFEFSILDVTVGRLTGALGIAENFAGKQIQSLGPTLQKALEDAGIHATVDMTTKKITYTKSALQTDIVTMMQGEQMVTTFIKEFLSLGLTSLNPSSGTAIEMVTDLTPLQTNAAYVSASTPDLHLDTHAAELGRLLDEGKVTSDANLMKNVFNYLVRGYQGSSEAIRNAVASIDFSSLGISDWTAYKGENPEANKVDIAKKLYNQITIYDVLANKHVGDIKESDVNSLLACAGVVGNCFIMNSVVNGTNQPVYFAIDDLRCEILDGKLNFILGINVNGCEIQAIICTEAKQSTSPTDRYKMFAHVTDFYLGEKKISADIQNLFRDYIKQAMNVSEYFSYDTASDTFIIDYTGLVDSTGRRAEIEAAGSPAFSFKGSSLTDPKACLSLDVDF